MTKEKKFPLKLVVLGGICGKSSLVERFAFGRFNDQFNATIGAAFNEHTVCLDDATVQFQIFDVSCCSPWLRPIHDFYYRDALAAIVVYDITYQESFSLAQKYVAFLQRKASPNILIALAGNKADLADRRMVHFEEAEAYAHENSLLFAETSAKTAMNVDNVFLNIESLHVLYQPRLRGFADEKRRQLAALQIDQRKLCLKITLPEAYALSIIPSTDLILAVKTAIGIPLDECRVRRSVESDRVLFVHFQHVEELEKAARNRIDKLKTIAYYDEDLQADHVDNQPQPDGAETHDELRIFWNVTSTLPIVVVVLAILLLLGAVKVGAVNGSTFIVFVLAVVFLSLCRDALSDGKDANELSIPAQE